MPTGLTITVARSGGFAGLTRTWALSSTLEEADDLLALVDACPWHDVRPVDHPASRDRFVYTITARAHRLHRAATVPEAALVGPWKVLVQRVQSARGPASGPSVPRETRDPGSTMDST